MDTLELISKIKKTRGRIRKLKVPGTHTIIKNL